MNDQEFLERWNTLTDREQQSIAVRCRTGLDRAAAAASIGSAVGTMTGHCNRALAKLDVRTTRTVGIAHVCYRLGRIDRDLGYED